MNDEFYKFALNRIDTISTEELREIMTTNTTLAATGAAGTDSTFTQCEWCGHSQPSPATGGEPATTTENVAVGFSEMDVEAERREFEAHARKCKFPLARITIGDVSAYEWEPVEKFWQGWLARAATGTPAKSASGEAEKAPSGAPYGIIDPDYGRIYTIVRTLAWQEGYAIGLHGSFTRDLDMIAVPWAETGNRNPEKLVARIVQATGLTIHHNSPGIKPHGRRVWTLLLPDFGDPRFVDLSIMPVPAKETA